MTRRTGWFSLLLSIALAALLLPATIGGCQDSGDDDDDGTTGTGTQTGTTTGTNTGGGAGSGGGTGNSGGTGGDPTCGLNAVDATIDQITNPGHASFIGPEVAVRLTGVVAMSRQFLVTKSSSGNCLWGVFVSAPGLSVTEPYSGILALSYGTPAEIPEGGTEDYCPVPGFGNDVSGSSIPDAVKPGDVLDLIGETAYFLLDQYCTNPGDSQVPARQLGVVCHGEITGTAAVPAPAVVPANDIPLLGSPTDTAFHDQWGGVKVRIENVNATSSGQACEGTGTESIVGDYGVVTLQEGSLEVGDQIYYQGLLRSQGDDCRAGPVICTPPDPVPIARLDGFNYLNFCTWGLQPNDKCADILDGGGAPLSQDCNGSTTTCAQ